MAKEKPLISVYIHIAEKLPIELWHTDKARIVTAIATFGFTALAPADKDAYQVGMAEQRQKDLLKPKTKR